MSREYRDPARCRPTFQTSPQAPQRQYASTDATLLVVLTSCDRHTGQRDGGAASPGAASAPRVWSDVDEPPSCDRRQRSAMLSLSPGLRKSDIERSVPHAP